MKITTILFIGLMMFMSITAQAQTAKSKTDPLQVGETAPDFTLFDLNKKEVNLSKIGKPVILVFFRGYWCPFCRRQLSELRSLIKPDDKVSLYAISVDPINKSTELAQNIAKDGKGELNFPILSDPYHKTIDAFGVSDPAYNGKEFEGIPHPAIFILDKDRKILWTKVEPDYRKRPTNDELRTEIGKIK
jgi:peroxiredoxin